MILLHISIMIFLLLICKLNHCISVWSIIDTFKKYQNTYFNTLYQTYSPHTHIMLTIWGCSEKKYKQNSNKFDKIMKQSQGLEIDL